MDTNRPHDLSDIHYEGGHDHKGERVGIVVSKWNDEITETLYNGAVKIFKESGILEKDILRFDVPGSFELPMGAQAALNRHPFMEGVVCLGCIIQGETRHFEFIADAVAQGIMRVSLDAFRPAIFGVLTPDTDQQAKDRAGGKYGNKGEEAAIALLEMIDLKKNRKSKK